MSPKPTSLRTLKLAVIMAITLILWSSAFVAIPIAVRDYRPEHAAVFRQMITLVLLLPLLIMRFRSSVVPALRKHWKGLLLMAFTGVAFYQFALNFGQQTVAAGSASLMTNLSPMVAALLAAFFLKENLSARLAIGGLVAFAGVVLLILGEAGSLSIDWNAAWVLAAMLAQSIYFIVQRRLTLRHRPSTVVAIGLVMGSLMLLPFAGGLTEAISNASLRSSLAVIYLGVFMIIPFAGWGYVLSRMEVAKAVLWLYLVPPLATAMGWAVLGDQPTTSFLVSGAIILTGLAIAQIPWAQIPWAQIPWAQLRWRPRRRLCIKDQKEVCSQTAE